METLKRIPIVVKALMIGAGDSGAKYATVTADFQKAPLNPLGTLIPSQLMSSKNVMEKGVHLHWNLPEQYVHGVEGEDGVIEFPPVPGKWVVTRLWSKKNSNNGTIESRSFVVESDALSSIQNSVNCNQGSPTVPTPVGVGLPYRYVGCSYALDKTKPDIKERLDKLMAVGAGNPAFAAFYPDCTNVFGFYDDMKDGQGKLLQDVVLTYVVCGFDSKDIVCHGAISSMYWESELTKYEVGIPKTTPVIAVGNNSAEALSVIATKLGGTKEYAERMVHHLLDGNKGQISEPNGIIKSEQILKENQFGVQTNEKQIGIKKAEGTDPETEPNAKAYELLDKINGEKVLICPLEYQVCDMQEQVYDNWVKYLSLSYPPNKTQAAIKYKKKCEDEIHELEIRLTAAKNELESKKKLVGRLTEELQQILSKDFYIVDQGGQHFYEPNDPVLLLLGAGKDDTRFFEEESKDIKQSLAIPQIGCLKKPITILASELLTKQNYQNQSYDDSFAYILETALLSPSFARNIAITALNKDSSAISEQNIARIEKEISKLQRAEQGPILEWKPPWYPLYLVWKAVFYPDKRILEQTPSIKNWRWNGNDYVYDGEKILLDTGKTFSGRSILTPSITVRLSQISQEELGSSYSAETLEVISQFLNGFNEKFHMRELRLQMPIFDFQTGNPELAKKVDGLLQGYDRQHPDFNGFYSPIRGGYLFIEKFQIIDTFGQILEVEPNGVMVSEYLRDNDEPFQKRIMLPPRIITPSRLDFRWENDSSRTPICGWLLPNLLEQHISVYNSEGEHLGYIQTVDMVDEKVVWKNPPHLGGGTGDIPKNIDRDLYAFVSEIISRWSQQKTNLLGMLLTVIDRSMWQINPTSANQFNGLGMFLCRPLVLAKAKLRYQTVQKQREYKEFILDDKPDKKELPNIKKAEFPFRIGNRENHNDGVVGFFAEGNYYRLMVCSGPDQYDCDYFCNDNYVKLSPVYDGGYANITLLMDPMGEVSFTSGILPVKTAKIDNELLEKALRKINYTIFSAPVISSELDFHIPYSEIEGKQWKYLCSNGVYFTEMGEVKQSTDYAYFQETPIKCLEGWLSLDLYEKRGD